MTITPATNNTFPKGGVSCSKDSLLVNQTLVFKSIPTSRDGKSTAHRNSAKC